MERAHKKKATEYRRPQPPKSWHDCGQRAPIWFIVICGIVLVLGNLIISTVTNGSLNTSVERETVHHWSPSASTIPEPVNGTSLSTAGGAILESEARVSLLEKSSHLPQRGAKAGNGARLSDSTRGGNALQLPPSGEVNASKKTNIKTMAVNNLPTAAAGKTPATTPRSLTPSTAAASAPVATGPTSSASVNGKAQLAATSNAQAHGKDSAMIASISATDAKSAAMKHSAKARAATLRAKAQAKLAAKAKPTAKTPATATASARGKPSAKTTAKVKAVGAERVNPDQIATGDVAVAQGSSDVGVGAVPETNASSTASKMLSETTAKAKAVGRPSGSGAKTKNAATPTGKTKAKPFALSGNAGAKPSAKDIIEVKATTLGKTRGIDKRMAKPATRKRRNPLGKSRRRGLRSNPASLKSNTCLLSDRARAELWKPLAPPSSSNPHNSSSSTSSASSALSSSTASSTEAAPSVASVRAAEKVISDALALDMLFGNAFHLTVPLCTTPATAATGTAPTTIEGTAVASGETSASSALLQRNPNTNTSLIVASHVSLHPSLIKTSSPPTAVSVTASASDSTPSVFEVSLYHFSNSAS